MRAYHPDTHTYDLAVRDGEPLSNIPRLVDSPGKAEILPRDALVAVHDELGFWVVDKVLAIGVINRTEVDKARVSEVDSVGGQDPVYAGGGDTNGRPLNAPDDLTEADWAQVGPDGNLVAVLRGGVNVFKSSPLAQVRTHQLEDLVEIISDKFRHITAMGELNVKNVGGKTSLTWRAGADQLNEAGASEENWTIHLDVGAEGDLFTFEITSPQGQSLARVHMSSDGQLELFGAAGVLITSGDRGVVSEVAAGDKHAEVHGDLTEVVRGAATITTGRRKTTVKGADSVHVTGNRSEGVGGDKNDLVGGRLTQRVVGGPGVYEYVNGGIEVTLGDPALGTDPAAKFNAEWVNFAGGFTFATPPSPTGARGEFTVMSSEPNSVQLGVDGVVTPDPVNGGYKITPVPGLFRLMKFEPFAALLKVMFQLFDAHVHQSSAPGTPTSPPAAPFLWSAALQAFVPPIGSERVVVGA